MSTEILPISLSKKLISQCFLECFLQLLFLVAMLLVGRQLEMGSFYYGGLFVAAGFGNYQQYLIRNREAAACFKAFLNNNWFGAAIFCGIVLHYINR